MKSKKEPFSMLGFMSTAVVIIGGVAVLADVMPGHWKQTLLFIFASLIVCFAAFMLLVGLSVQDARKKKEEEEQEEQMAQIREKRAELEAEIEALHLANTAAQPSAHGKGIGNATEAEGWDVLYVHAANGETRKVGEGKQVRGNAVELEINDQE